MTDDIPNPGSDAAIAAGCKCPIIDNYHGRGFPYGGNTSFWINGECPLHGKNDVESADGGRT